MPLSYIKWHANRGARQFLKAIGKERLRDMDGVRPVRISARGLVTSVQEVLVSAGRDIEAADLERCLVGCDFFYSPLVLAVLEGARPQEVRRIMVYNEENEGNSLDGAPVALYLERPGFSVACWGDEASGLLVLYDAGGAPLRGRRFGDGKLCGEDDPTSQAPSLASVMGALRESVIVRRDRCEKAIGLLAFDPEEHGVAYPQDGSIVIFSKRTGRIDNPCGPAAMSASGKLSYYREGREIDEARFRPETRPFLAQVGQAYVDRQLLEPGDLKRFQ